jgi:hypothetical protein
MRSRRSMASPASDLSRGAAGDPLMATARVLSRQPQHQFARGAAGRWTSCGYVHFLRTSFRCQRSSVAGVTTSPGCAGAGVDEQVQR